MWCAGLKPGLDDLLLAALSRGALNDAADRCGSSSEAGVGLGGGGRGVGAAGGSGRVTLGLLASDIWLVAAVAAS